MISGRQCLSEGALSSLANSGGISKEKQLNLALKIPCTPRKTKVSVLDPRVCQQWPIAPAKAKNLKKSPSRTGGTKPPEELIRSSQVGNCRDFPECPSEKTPKNLMQSFLSRCLHDCSGVE
ncbi:hypothetical protein RUM43_002806 [Polyplax serrata]|uniref:Uncharacterized protein n=1 Tax=Polyplax serrata TaxID=468196 RepID=A0AAN8S681_POLSC